MTHPRAMLAGDDADRHWPVEFDARALGAFTARLGPWEVGEIRPAEHVAHAYHYVVRLPGLPNGWRRPVPLDAARERIARAVRDWIEATPIAAWIERERAHAAAAARRSSKGTG